jgi:hypothetical protein
MRIATLFVLMGALTTVSLPAFADLPQGKVAVIRVTAIDGLARAGGAVTETRNNVFSFDGSTYMIKDSAVGGLDGVQTLVLIDRRTDKSSGDSVIRENTQEVRAVKGTYFEVTDIPNKVLGYQVATVGGNLRVSGDGDQILCTGGKLGEYHIWKVDSVDLVDRTSIHVR